MGIPLVAAHLLCQRGVRTPEQLEVFLAPKLNHIPSPLLLKDTGKGVDLVVQAMEEGWPVVVYGDYDVDGICATSLLVEFLSLLHLDVHWHIPNRLTEGYGLNSATLQQLRNQVDGPALLITVDNGISAFQEVEEARAAGFHVLITDHHEPLQDLPKADAVINPKQQDCAFPCKDLSGAGVAFFLIIALRSKLIEKGFWQRDTAPNLKNYLDLVALGTVADVMSLSGVNRVLVRAGVEVLTARKRPGVWALCEQIGLREGDITAEDISFRLAPRINAAGRMGSPVVAAELLMSSGVKDAIGLARQLEQQNKKRRSIETEILDDAIVQCEEQVENNVPALVVYKKGWHPGVIGIVASRLCDRYFLPAIALTDDSMKKGHIKGSGRTVGKINIFNALTACEHHLDRFGGHPKAIGLSMKQDNLSDFKNEFRERVSDQFVDSEQICREVMVDYHIGNDVDVHHEMISFLRQLEPFGEDNPEPVFLIKNRKLSNVSLIKDEHLKFSLRLNDTTYRGIGFYMKESLRVADRNIDMAFTFKHSVFRGEKRVELMAVAIDETC